MTEYLPGTNSETPQALEKNLLATERLLGALRSEAEHPQSVINRDVWFEDDGSFDASIGPPLAEVPDPDNMENGYLVGLRPDGVGQVVMLQRERGGVVGRVVITLQEGKPTRLLGERRTVWHPQSGLSRPERINGQLVPLDLLDQLGSALPEAFDAKRAWLYGARRGFLWVFARAITRALKPSHADTRRAIER